MVELNRGTELHPEMGHMAQYYGAAFVILGLIAIGSMAFTLDTVLLMTAVILILAGLVRYAWAMWPNKGMPSEALHYLTGLPALILGIALFFYPEMTLTEIAFYTAIYFAAEGALDMALMMRVERGAPGRVSLAITGLIAWALAVALLVPWPFLDMWAIGAAVGVRLLTIGIRILAYGPTVFMRKPMMPAH